MSVSDINKVNNKSKLNIAFIADDLRSFNEFDLFHNATFALMLASQELKAKVFLTESRNLKIINNTVIAKFDEVLLKHELNNYLKVTNTLECSFDVMDIVFARKDPPIDENFIAYAQTLTLLGGKKPFVVNNPCGILKANEKLYPLNFPEIIPQTIVTSSKTEMLFFLNEHKEAVIKPLFNKGGEGVFYLSKGSKDIDSIFEKSNVNEKRQLLVQKYISDVLSGDKRIVLLNGEPLGAIYRVPKKGEFRANVRRGATVKACQLSKRDLKICATLKPSLVKDNIYFASIDIIGDYLIEVNVTCPASLQEVERCTGRSVAKEIVQWAIDRASCYQVS